MTKKEFILQSFQKMDTRMLDVLLDESYTYQNCSKEFFVGKLNEVFSELRDARDTELFSISGQCKNEECPNKGCKGFTFVGNRSGMHLDLIFDETQDDFVDIYECHDFTPLFKLDHQTCSVNLDIKSDDQLDFKPGVELLIRLQSFRQAFDELATVSKMEMLGPDIYLAWLEKYRALYQTITVPPILYRAACDFYELYNTLQVLASFICMDSDAQKAYEEYLNIPLRDEIALLNWLTRYEDLGKEMLMFHYPDTKAAKEMDKGYFIIHSMRMRILEFENMILFKNYFEPCYDQMIEKYRVVDESSRDTEQDIMYITKPDESLTKYLKQRKIID